MAMTLTFHLKPVTWLLQHEALQWFLFGRTFWNWPFENNPSPPQHCTMTTHVIPLCFHYLTPLHSSNGKFIVCGSEDQFVYIWRLQHEFYKFSSARRDRNDYWEGIKGMHKAVIPPLLLAHFLCPCMWPFQHVTRSLAVARPMNNEHGVGMSGESQYRV